MSLMKEQKKEIINQYRQSDSDTGSVEVQVALLTNNIKSLTEHMKIHKKDFHSRRGLLKMVSTRRKLLKYLKEHSMGRYGQLIKNLGLRH